MSLQIAGNLDNSSYPHDTDRIVRQLVRLIGAASTWQDVIEASNAIFHVQLKADSLRSEQNMMAQKEAARQAAGQINMAGVSATNANSWRIRGD